MTETEERDEMHEKKPAKPAAVRMAIERQMREKWKKEGEAVLENLAEGPYRGLIMAHCEACGEISGYRPKNPAYSVRCRECGEEIPLERMRPLHVNCPCGARWNYITNVQPGQDWTVRCHTCGRALEVRMGRKGVDWIAGERYRRRETDSHGPSGASE